MATVVETLKPPVTSVGVLGWLRKNLFSSWFNSLLTIFMLWVIYNLVVGIWGFITTARWEVVPVNLRLFMVGRYPLDQVWRVEVSVAILTFLLGASWRAWGGIMQQVAISIAGLLVALALGGLVVTANSTLVLWIVFALALVLGVTAVLPIGGADMPVVISLLNSFTGVAAALTGFVVQNQILIVAGALVGASGTLLTLLMSRAMNRPISNVLFSGFGAIQAGGNGRGPGLQKIVKEASAEDVGVALAFARNVVIVPGYGLAVAQAQHTVRELADELEKHGVHVKYAIHPVAGRMPGHMNVLLAEANVPYDQLAEMEQINGEFDNTDVSLVIGANDVVNPAARNDPASPIYGMPILDVDHSRNVVVLKRSMNPGFAGIDNELFYRDNTRMLFGDAKASLTKLVSAVKTL